MLHPVTKYKMNSLFHFWIEDDIILRRAGLILNLRKQPARMKHTALITALFLTIAPIVESIAQQHIPLADPFILLHENTYYAYGTHADRGIEVYTSHDLTEWSQHNKLALDRNDTWGERWFWAPEVYSANGRFYMYYSADQHLCVAVADSPLGPFAQLQASPLIDSPNTIDGSVYIDEKGRTYLFFAELTNTMNICMVELTTNMLNIKPQTVRHCLEVSENWEKVWPNVIQGPFVFRHHDTYYMLFSANSYESQYCNIGYATAPEIWGPWTKNEENPLLQKDTGLVGTGHASLFTDKQNALRLAFHSHYDQTSIHPRKMHIAKIKFKKGVKYDTLTIDDSILTPLLK